MTSLNFLNESRLSQLSWSTVVLGCLIFGVTTYTLRTIAQKRKGKLPPGPPGLPFLGNLFQLTVDVWVRFTEWKYQYGDLVHISVVGQNIVILNSHKVAADLLDRRAAIYSSRPRLIVASEILTGGYLIPFAPHNDLWRKMRRASHEGLNASTARGYYPSQLRESALLVQGMLRDPSKWDNELKRAATSMILGVVYDKSHIDSSSDPSIAYSNDFIARIVRAAFPGAHYVEFFTWMKHLPPAIAKWKRDALTWFDKDSKYFGEMYETVEKRVLVEGDERPSFTSSLVKDERHLGLTKNESAWLAATIYATGGETTSTVMAWFMLAMVHFPEVQARAQAELDAVVGRDRMPTFEDRDHLPYIQGCVRETLRWRTAAPVGVPHYSTEDDWYNGHFIPKGTIMIPNQWSMNRDPDVYGDDVHLFKPERYMDADGKVAPLPPALADTKDGHVGYGFGRRICVGRHVANNSVFIDIAALLWGTNIKPVTDAQGKPIMPDTEGFVNDGLVIRPLPFDCNITPRFPEVHSVVAESREMWE